MKKTLPLSLKKLQSLYNFEVKSPEHKDLSLSDLKMLLFLSDYRDNYAPITFSYTFLLNNTNIKKKSSLNKTILNYGFEKDKETGLYSIKLSSDWRINNNSKKREFKQYNTIEDRRNTNRYASLPINIKNILIKSSNLNFWKLTLYILYKTHSDPSISFKYNFKDLMNKLSIKMSNNNKPLYILNFYNYFVDLYNANFIGDFSINKDTIIFYKNILHIENKYKKEYKIKKNKEIPMKKDEIKKKKDYVKPNMKKLTPNDPEYKIMEKELSLQGIIIKKSEKQEEIKSEIKINPTSMIFGTMSDINENEIGFYFNINDEI